MSLTTQTSPSTKLQAKEAAHNRFKYGSPKLRDLLRQQCRIRLKDRRNNNFIEKRKLLHEMDDLVKKEISQFEQNEKLQDLIYDELKEEMEQWLIEETQYLSELDTIQEVICPLCQKRPLVQNKIFMTQCDNCGFCTRQYPDLMKLGDNIKIIFLQHEVKCPHTLMFFTEPKLFNDPLSMTINAICDACEYYAAI